MAGRWGWQIVADQLGVASGAVVPLHDPDLAE
jgi:hypothetical protein